jgi:hypothetical protein
MDNPGTLKCEMQGVTQKLSASSNFGVLFSEMKLEV